MLLAELDRSEAALIPVLRRRAADWCLDNGLPEQALEYAITAGDVDMAARLVEQLWRLVYWSLAASAGCVGQMMRFQEILRRLASDL